MKYVWRNGAWRDPDGNVMEAPDRIGMPRVQSDISDYYSVVSNKWVSGRTDRRYDLESNNCRPAEPIAKKDMYCTTKKWAERLGVDYNPTGGRPKHWSKDWSSKRT
jgi:hypothetical protein